MRKHISVGLGLIALVGATTWTVACSDVPTATEPTGAKAAAAGETADVATSTAVAASQMRGQSTVGGVYTATNSASGNTVVAYARSNQGALTRIGTFKTFGTGIGGTVDPLASQFSLVLSAGDSRHRTLYVVNAGSNDITAFRVHDDGSLEWLQRIGTGGVTPISLALHRDRLYALNAGDSSVSTFDVANDGGLSQLSGGRKSLPGGVGGPSTIRVSDDGDELFVTERTANRIDVFPLGLTGLPGNPMTVASQGMVPFGFDVGHDRLVLVSEAGPNAVSSYRWTRDALKPLVASVPTDGQATCWLRLTHDLRNSYTANAASSSISSFAVDHDGHLTLIDLPTALPSGATPLDLDVTADDQYVYVLETGAGAIGALKRNASGSLTMLAGAAGAVTPASGAQGVAAW